VGVSEGTTPEEYSVEFKALQYALFTCCFAQVSPDKWCRNVAALSLHVLSFSSLYAIVHYFPPEKISTSPCTTKEV
jgi:hypothetical protein